MKKTGNVVVCCMGESATNEGSFHECLNMASIWKLPLIFYVINNNYGISMSQQRSMTAKRVVDRAEAYKVKSIYVEDGNNVLDVYDAMSEAIEYAREGNGPVLVESKSYRWFGHSASDAGKYRDKAEVDAWKEKDPNVAYKKYLIENEIATEKELDDMEENVKKIIADAITFAKESPLANEKDAFTDNYA